MTKARWDQVSFTRGEIDPRVQMRVDWQNYYKSAKKIRNSICTPQGGVTRRWGTEHVDPVATDAANYRNVELASFLVNDNVVYLLLWEATGLTIYLEDVKVYNITVGYPYKAEDIPNLKFSQASTRLVITDGNHKPYQLIRNPNDPGRIIATGRENPNTLVCNGIAVSKNVILPVQFKLPAGATIPSTTPQIFTGRDYFIKTNENEAVNGHTTFRIYSSSSDASTNNNPYIINNAGNGQTHLIIFNSWQIKEATFIHYPTYDFLANYLYSSVIFTITSPDPNETVTITCAGTVPGGGQVANVFNDNHKDGMFVGGDFTVRITKINSPLSITGNVIIYPNRNPVGNTTEQGDLCLCAEKAFSEVRGWPRNSTVYQNRLVLAGTASIPNGQWLSNIGVAFDFDESETHADNAISSFPASGSVSFIKSLTSARSLLVHTNTGNYSTSMQNEMAVTPNNYMLTEHNKFGIGDLQPVYIDNQLFFVDRSGNNIINMCWDFIQGNYVTNSISIAASSLVRTPIDMAAFSEPLYLDGFYVLFVNSDGTICILQTLKEEEILAFSLADSNSYLILDQNSTHQKIQSRYRKVVTAQNMCWFLTSKQYCYKSQINCRIESVDRVSNSFSCNTGGDAINGNIYRCVFSLNPINNLAAFPNTTPSIVSSDTNPNISNIYFVKYTAVEFKFKLYGSTEDALFKNEDGEVVGKNDYVINTDGTDCSITLYIQKEKLFIEKVNFKFYADFSSTVTSPVLDETGAPIPTNIFNGLDHLNGQIVKVIAYDTVGNKHLLQDKVVVDGKVKIEKDATTISVGLPFQSMLVPLPPAIPEQPGMLFNPMRIRTMYISYYNTVGATIQGYGIPVQTIGEVTVGVASDFSSKTGIFTYAPMEGWEVAMQNDLQIIQEQPLPMTITGLSYVIDISK